MPTNLLSINYIKIILPQPFSAIENYTMLILNHRSSLACNFQYIVYNHRAENNYIQNK
jgi:hypothetical protein